MEKKINVDWIELEFLAGYPYGHYRLRYKPDGTIEYTGDGDLPTPLNGSHEWSASPRVYKNLERNLMQRRWEHEIDPAGEDFMVCDGWSETLRWSIQGETHEFTIQIGVGPESILKIIGRMNKLLKEKEKRGL